MLRQLRQLVYEHVRQHPALYIFLIVLFIAGIVFGALSTGALDKAQLAELTHYLDHFLNTVKNDSVAPAPPVVFRSALLHYGRTVGLLFLLGLSIVGALGIPLIVFLRGFILGFSAGFLLSNLGWPGFFIVLLALLPQNLLFIPALLILAAASLTFVLAALRYRQLTRGTLWSAGGRLAIIGLAALLLVVAASCLEGYAAPGLLRFISRWYS